MINIKSLSLEQGEFLLEIDRLTIQPNQLVAVMGNNGSGKSTFLSALSGLKPFTGEYLLDETPFVELTKQEQSQQISLFPQHVSLNMPFDVNYVVLTGRFPYVSGNTYSKQDQDLTDQIMDEFDLGALRHRQFNELSGGEKQRVLLARMINRDSSIILLDEPLASVDIKHQYEVLEILKAGLKNRIIMVVIHDIHIAFQTFDRFIFFNKGKLVYDTEQSELDAEKISDIFQVNISFENIKNKRIVQVGNVHL